MRKRKTKAKKNTSDIKDINPYIRVKNKTELKALYCLYRHHSWGDIFPNIYTPDIGEIDCLYISKSGYATYYEVKASKADFNNDFKKPRHEKLLARDQNISWKPKYFIYILSGFTLDPTELPEYAGAYYLTSKGLALFKKPPMVFNKKLDLHKVLHLIYRRLAYRYLSTQYKFGMELLKKDKE